MLGREDVVGQSSFVGQQQQSLRILVQPPHRKQSPPPELRRQQVQHCGPPAVLRGGEDPRRLMKHDPGVAAAVQHGPVHHNLHCFRHHLVLRRPGRHTVHQHPALADQEPHFPPGVCPLPGDDLVQTRFLHAGLLLADLCLFLPLLFPRDEHGRLSSDGLFCFILS